jgi:hypothetical protein
VIKIYRDGIEHILDKGCRVSIRTTSDGHVIESWKERGKRVYFANLSDGVYCAHGETQAQAIGDAIWKDPKRRPSLEALVAEIKPKIKTRKISIKEFQILTGACQSGCVHFLKTHNLPLDTEMTLTEFMPIGGDWAKKLNEVLM